MRRARRRIDERDRLAHEFTAPDNPIECILQDARHAVRVFGTRQKNRVGLIERGPEGGDRFGRIVGIQVGIEWWKVSQPVEDGNVDVVWRQSDSGTNEGAVRRRPTKAS